MSMHESSVRESAAQNISITPLGYQHTKFSKLVQFIFLEEKTKQEVHAHS